MIQNDSNFAAVEEYIEWLRYSFSPFDKERLICKLRCVIDAEAADLLEHLNRIAFTLLRRGERYIQFGGMRRNTAYEQGLRLCETICHLSGVTDYITLRIEQPLE